MVVLHIEGTRNQNLIALTFLALNQCLSRITGGEGEGSSPLEYENTTRGLSLPKPPALHHCPSILAKCWIAHEKPSVIGHERVFDYHLNLSQKQHCLGGRGDDGQVQSKILQRVTGVLVAIV